MCFCSDRQCFTNPRNSPISIDLVRCVSTLSSSVLKQNFVLCFFGLFFNSQVLNMIAEQRALFVAQTAVPLTVLPPPTLATATIVGAGATVERGPGVRWLPAQLTKACTSYNSWRHDGAINWPTVQEKDLTDLIRLAPNTHDPILRGPRLGYFQKAEPKLNHESRHGKEKGRPNTRGARKASIAAPVLGKRRRGS